MLQFVQQVGLQLLGDPLFVDVHGGAHPFHQRAVVVQDRRGLPRHPAISVRWRVPVAKLDPAGPARRDRRAHLGQDPLAIIRMDLLAPAAVALLAPVQAGIVAPGLVRFREFAIAVHTEGHGRRRLDQGLVARLGAPRRKQRAAQHGAGQNHKPAREQIAAEQDGEGSGWRVQRKIRRDERVPGDERAERQGRGAGAGAAPDRRHDDRRKVENHLTAIGQERRETDLHQSGNRDADKGQQLAAPEAGLRPYRTKQDLRKAQIGRLRLDAPAVRRRQSSNLKLVYSSAQTVACVTR